VEAEGCSLEELLPPPACGLDTAGNANWLPFFTATPISSPKTKKLGSFGAPARPVVSAARGAGPIGFVLRFVCVWVIRFLSLFRVSSFVLRISRGHQDPGELASFSIATPVSSPGTKKLGSFDTAGTSAAPRQACKLGSFDIIRRAGKGGRLQAPGIPPVSGLRLAAAGSAASPPSRKQGTLSCPGGPADFQNCGGSPGMCASPAIPFRYCLHRIVVPAC